MQSEVKTLRIDFSEIPVRETDIYRLMGYPEGIAPEGISYIYNEMMTEAPSHFEIQGGYLVADIDSLNTTAGTIQVNNVLLSPGKIICRNLLNSQKAIFFLCTAGGEAREWATETMKSDPVKGLMIDLLGSIVADSAADLIEADIQNSGYRITNRYSPGYCGWKLVEQKKLFSLFPENFCGITLTPSSLMLPVKSVSGIIGSGENVEKGDYDCEICDANDCIFRSLKETSS